MIRTCMAVVACCAALLPGAGAAQSDAAVPLPVRDRAAPMPITRIDTGIRLDGVVDEPAWDGVPFLPMTMFSPSYGGQLTERSEVRLAHDDRYLYVSGRLYDSDPSQIRTNTFIRDAYSGDDLLAVVIDSYNDYETALWFVTNPAGTRNDRTVSNDAVFSGGGMPMNSDWNAHWEVATSQDDDGWYAEFRIPFSTLGFQAVDDRVTMGLIIYRFIGRKNERHTFPDIDPRHGGMAFARPSQAQRITLSNVRPARPLYITPYALSGLNQVAELRDASSPQAAWRTTAKGSNEAGLDVKYAPMSNLTLDLTINTDFAQVEADDQQINLTRFPLFFPEKRQFFQERSSTFQFATGGQNRLFHSRRIGLDGGEIVRIYGGVRAVGRLGGMDFGLLDMQTAAHDGRSSENMAVLRLSQQVLNPYSSIGAMVTSRLGNDGEDNVAYGLDAVLRPFGDEWITAKWAQTFDERINEASPLEAGLIVANWQRIRDSGFSYGADYMRVGRDYEPRLGFQARRNFQFYGGRGQYKRFLSPASPLRAASAELSTGHYIRGEDGSAESRSWEPQASLEFKQGHELSVSGSSSYESVRSAFAIAGATIPVGDYWFHSARLRLQLPRSDLVRGDFTADAGSFYDGSRAGFAVNPMWNPSKYLELGAGYELNRIDFDERDQSTNAHLARLRAQIALNTRVSLNALAQYSNVADLASFNARFRYHFREGTDLWLVYNEGLNTERDVLDRPRLPVSAGRTLMVKYTHTFIR